jgi:hypothetical protein
MLMKPKKEGCKKTGAKKDIQKEEIKVCQKE